MALAWLTDATVERVVDAPAEAVYRVAADVTADGRSEECRRAEWLAGHDAPVVGARFRGHNRFRLARWSRVCEVVEADPGHAFAFRTVPSRWDPTRMDSTTWRYDLVPQGEQTLVRHSYTITRPPLRPLMAVYGVLLPHHRDMRPAMAATLEALERSLTSSTGTAGGIAHH